MTPSQLVDMHIDLQRRMGDSRFARVLKYSFQADLDALYVGNKLPSMERKRVEENATYLSQAHVRHVGNAECYKVEPEMMPLLHAAAAALETSDKFNHRLAPTPSGIVRFDEPIKIIDIRGMTLKAHWLVWGPAQAQNGQFITLLTWYNDLHDPDEIGADESVRNIIGRWAWIGAEYRIDGSKVGDSEFIVPPVLASRVIEDGHTPAAHSTNLTRYAHALWLLLGQTITAIAQEDADRAARRRAERVKPPIPSRVSVISLRRKEYRHVDTDPDSAPVEWSHRWYSRAHWRWQEYGHRTADHTHEWGTDEVNFAHIERYCTVEGCDQHVARILVAPSIKGPADKPLVITHKIYDLAR